MAFPRSADEDSPDGVTIVGRHGAGPALNQINAVHSMAVDAVREILYFADSENHRVMKWNFDDEGLELVAGTGVMNSDKASFNLPLGITIDEATGELYVVDSRNHRVQKFPLNSREGITVAAGKGEGASLSQLRLPSGVVLDAVGSVYVADTGNHRIVQWLAGAQQGRVIAGRAIRNLHLPSVKVIPYPTNERAVSSRNWYVWRESGPAQSPSSIEIRSTSEALCGRQKQPPNSAFRSVIKRMLNKCGLF